MLRISYLEFSFLLALLALQISSAQEHTFLFSVSAGLARMSLDQVDEDNQRDVEGWNLQGVPIGSFPSMKNAFMLSLKGSYRYDRDIALLFSISDASQEVSTSYNTSDQTLELIRSVGFTDATFGVLYHFPLYYDIAESYAGAEIGVMWARARAKAYGTRTRKIADSTETVPTVDTKGTYKANKTIVNALAGMTVQVFEPLFLSAELKYKVGKVGKMDGHVTRIGDERDETTSIEFDYSGLLVTLGLGVRF